MTTFSPQPTPTPFPAAVAPTLLRRTMGHFATGVTVITARDASGRAVGSTASAVASVSLDPPLVLVCLKRDSRTLAAMAETGHFAVNILRADQRPLSERFARRTGPDVWAGVAQRNIDGVPVLDSALALLVCEMHDTGDGGDHLVVVGRVVAADHPDEHLEPLLFYRSRYAGLELGDPPGAPPPSVEVALPSDLGNLRMIPLAPDGESGVSVAVLVGKPRGRAGVLLYAHSGCIVGDAMGGSMCSGHRRLRRALARMGDAGAGVVVYHRDADQQLACCLGHPGGDSDRDLSEAGVVAVRRAVRALALRDICLMADRAAAGRLAEAGVPVGAWVSSASPSHAAP